MSGGEGALRAPLDLRAAATPDDLSGASDELEDGDKAKGSGASLSAAGPGAGCTNRTSSSAIVSFILGLANPLTSSCAWRATCIEW